MPSIGATTGTYGFQPATGELVVAAYRRVGVHRAEILTEHLTDARMEMNLMQVQFANLGPLLFTVDLQTVALIAGQSVYSVPANTVMILDMYVSTPNGDGTNSDRIMTSISRSEYAATPDKLTQSPPTSWWFDRLISPTITLWPVPDGTEPTFSYYRFTQIQDAVTANAGVSQVPYLMLDAYVAGLAFRLSVIYKPERSADLKVEAGNALTTFFNQYTEFVPLYIQPQIYQYYK